MNSRTSIWIRTYSLGLILFLLSIFSAYGQNMVDSQKSGEEIFTARVKQLNEFANRFNYKDDFNGNPIDESFMAKMPREKMLSLLFDMKDPRSGQGSKDYDDSYNKSIKDFISEVSEKKLIINKNSPEIIAEARARIVYKGKAQTISLFLNQERAGKGSYKWVLLSAKGEIFNVFKEDSTMMRFIPPASHETDFMNLKRALEDTDHLQDYAFDEFKPDLLTLFFFCIQSGIVKYEYVENVTYHIIDIPGWYFKVKDFNRNELNSGWLISDVSKNTLSLTEFIKSL